MPVPLLCQYNLRLPCCKQKQLQPPEPPDSPLCYMIPKVDSINSFLANLPLILAYVFSFPTRVFLCSAYDFIYYFLPIFTDIALIIDTFINWLYGSIVCFGYGLILGLSGDALLSLLNLASVQTECSIDFNKEALTPLCPLGANTLNVLCKAMKILGEVFGSLLAFFVFFTDAVNFLICVLLNLGIQVCVGPFGCKCVVIYKLINNLIGCLGTQLNDLLNCPCALCIYNTGACCRCLNPVVNICLGHCGQCGACVSGCSPVPFSSQDCNCESNVFR